MLLTRTCVFVLLVSFMAGCGGEKPLAEYKDPAGKFTIQFPGTPKSQTTPGKGGISVNGLAVEGSSWAYTLTYYDVPGGVSDNDIEQIKGLGVEIFGIYQAMNGKEEESTFSKLQDRYRAVEHHGTVTKPKSLNLRGPSYIVGDRVYNVMVLGSKDKVNSETATKFLDSFKIDEPVEKDEKVEK